MTYEFSIWLNVNKNKWKDEVITVHWGKCLERMGREGEGWEHSMTWSPPSSHRVTITWAQRTTLMPMSGVSLSWTLWRGSLSSLAVADADCWTLHGSSGIWWTACYFPSPTGALKAWTVGIPPGSRRMMFRMTWHRVWLIRVAALPGQGPTPLINPADRYWMWRVAGLK